MPRQRGSTRAVPLWCEGPLLHPFNVHDPRLVPVPAPKCKTLQGVVPFTDVHPPAVVSTNSDPLDLSIALLVEVELARLRIHATQAEPCALRADGTYIDRQPFLHRCI